METRQMTMRVIPKKVKPTVDIETGLKIKKKVAAYARVSTDLEDQKNSLNAQKDEYSRRIQEHEDWEFVNLYFDEGITGTSLKKRKGFNDMIEDAKAGLIDLILVKSISRFARNTVDCLQTVRELRAAEVEVFFEKEHLYASDKKANSMLTFYAQFAQEESQSISENVKWGIRTRMKRGDRKMSTATTLGYVTDPKGKVVVDSSEIRIIEKVFNLYLVGYSYRDIVNELNGHGWKTGAGSSWKISDVMRMLSNEKYIGTFVMQKTVVKDFLDHKAYKNDGIEEKYILDNHHESIITRKYFEMIQAIKEAKTINKNDGNPTCVVFNTIICEHCLRPLNIIHYKRYTGYKNTVLTCKTTAKSSLNYKNCVAKGTLNYQLVQMAIKEIFEHFGLITNEINTLLEESYKAAQISLSEEHLKLKDENEILQKKLSEILNKQVHGGDFDQCKFDYELTNKKIKANNQRILELKNELYVNLKKFKYSEKIDEYLKSGTLTYEVVHNYIKKGIRRKDNSVRFIFSDSDVEINETNVNSLLEINPIYKSSVTLDDVSLDFDVIRIGGKND